MKVGSKVIVKPEYAFIDKFRDASGIIKKEKNPESQAAMLSGVCRWIVEFDEPIVVCNEVITSCEFREDELVLAN